MLPRQSAFRAIRSLATEVGAGNNKLYTPTPPLSTMGPTTTRPRPLLEASVIVNRSPTVTRSPSRFEKTFFQYQSRIARALRNPFPYEFYFKQGSPLEAQFNIEERKRERQAFGRLTRTMWDTTDANLEAAELAKEEVGKRATRFTEADKRRDVHSLDRRGERHIYLMTKSEDGSWSFPQATIRRGEFLHQVRTCCYHLPFCLISSFRLLSVSSVRVAGSTSTPGWWVKNQSGCTNLRYQRKDPR
jgi:large subunit ribosomal protein L46